ncbi:MAG: IS5/IS1182 family transposase, partial [Pseudomonadota bacterium]
SQSYVPSTTYCSRFNRRRYSDVWNQRLETIAEVCDGDIVMTKNSQVHVLESGSARRENDSDARLDAFGCFRAGLTTNIHALDDAEGPPRSFQHLAGTTS